SLRQRKARLPINSGTSLCLNRGCGMNRTSEAKLTSMLSRQKVQRSSVEMMRKSTALLIVVVTVSVVGAGVAFMQRARRVSTAQRNGSILRLDRDGDLQSAIDQARPGDTIV